MINPGAIGICGATHSNLARYAILESGSSFMVTIKEVSYDSQRYIRIAENRGFPGKNYYMRQQMKDSRTA